MWCWFFKLRISDAADCDKPIGPWTQRHVSGCARCRQFHRRCDLLAEGLRSQASWLRPTGRAGIPAVGRRHSWTPIRAGIAAAACITVALQVGSTLLNRRPVAMNPPLPPTLTVAALRVDLTATWTRALETPLRTEARNLSDDAQSSVRFLVSCLNVGRFDTFAAPPLESSGPPM